MVYLIHSSNFHPMVSIKKLASGAIERDVMEEEGDLPNIDEADNENQLAVVEHVQDNYYFYWYKELSWEPCKLFLLLFEITSSCLGKIHSI